MTAENGHSESQTPPPHKFNAAEARQKAQEKAEFILSRAWGLVSKPDAEWEQIRGEETNVPSILFGYVAPLAALMSICAALGEIAFGMARMGTPITQIIIGNAVTFVVLVAMVFLLGLLLNAVAENFDADRDDLASQKVAAYSMTPFLLSGIFWLWPGLAWLSIIALGGSVYLLYRGLPILMKAPEERAIGYALSVAAGGLALFFILFGVSSCATSFH